MKRILVIGSLCLETEETVLRFKISLRETFSNSSFLRVKGKYDKSTVVEILATLGTR